MAGPPQRVAHAWQGWRARVRALRHVPMLLRLAWECGPWVVSAALACRLTGAMLPIAMLGVAKATLTGQRTQMGENRKLRL